MKKILVRDDNQISDIQCLMNNIIHPVIIISEVCMILTQVKKYGADPAGKHRKWKQYSG